jgi:hypothetical protein
MGSKKLVLHISHNIILQHCILEDNMIGFDIFLKNQWVIDRIDWFVGD